MDGGMIHYVVNVEAAIYHDDTWLVGVRSSSEDHAAGTLAMIGGKVEQAGISSDILESTLVREVKEEVGIDIDVEQYVRSTSFIADDGQSCH